MDNAQPLNNEKSTGNTPVYREVTFAAVFLGVIQGMIMSMAFVYAGLKLGFSLGGSTVAAIMGFTILKGIMKKGTIVENNINQTIASGINISGSGIIFTLPALMIMGIKFNPIYMVLSAIGAILSAIVVFLKKNNKKQHDKN